MGVEEGVLFELAEKVVSDDDDDAMSHALEQVAATYRENGATARVIEVLDGMHDYAAPSRASTG
jgi:hypothetical protein